MKFKIETNGHMFRVKFKHKWWPWWSYVYHYDEHSPREFTSKEAAEEVITNWSAAESPWREV